MMAASHLQSNVPSFSAAENTGKNVVNLSKNCLIYSANLRKNTILFGQKYAKLRNKYKLEYSQLEVKTVTTGSNVTQYFD